MELQTRMFHDIATESCPGEVTIPPDVILEDGLTEEEAVALALWNNRDFLSTLANLGITRGDLVQAGLLTNPQLNLLFPPIGSKQLEWTLYMPIEAIILRQQRIVIAERDFQRVCNDLVQNGLNVARDARLAFADFQFAADRYELAEEAVKVRSGLFDLAEKRFEAGDIGELEAINVRLDANRSRAEAAGLKRAVRVAEARLKLVMGIASLDTPLTPVEAGVPEIAELDEETLICEALAIRPDIKAARIAIQAAQHREELSRKSFLRLDAVADGNHGGGGPSNVGPGLRFEIPIFNRNQGLIIRSQWSVDQASHNFHSIRDQVVTDVRTALASVEQANDNLKILHEQVLPDLEDTMKLSESAYKGGGDTYFLVLQSTSQFIDSRISELQLQADLRRAVAELDRSVGRRIVLPTHEKQLLPVPQPATESQPLPFPNDQPELLPPEPSLQTNTSSETITPMVTVIVVQPGTGNPSTHPAMIADSLRRAAFQMSENQEQQVIVSSGFEAAELDSKRKLDEVYDCSGTSLHSVLECAWLSP